MSNPQKCKTPFYLQGELVEFQAKPGKPAKYLRIVAEGKEYCVKLKMPDLARADLQRTLKPGDRLQVAGQQTFKPETQEIKLKAYLVAPAGAKMPLIAPIGEPLPAMPTVPPEPSGAVATQGKPVARIMVCQKSSCRKRGAGQVCRMLEDVLHDRGLTEQIVVQSVGCLKLCDDGPNLAIAPGRSRYSNVQPAEVPAIVDRLIAANSSANSANF